MVFRLCEQNTSVEIEGNIGLYIFKLGPKEVLNIFILNKLFVIFQGKNHKNGNFSISY